MLRITVYNEDTLTRLIIEGKLVGDWVRELERCWLKAAAVQPPQRIRIEFTDVSFIDSAGRELLEKMAVRGAELIAVDVLMKAIVEDVLYGIYRNGNSRRGRREPE